MIPGFLSATVELHTFTLLEQYDNRIQELEDTIEHLEARLEGQEILAFQLESRIDSLNE